MVDTSTPLVIFGCGYTGTFLARAALADGQRVRACARNLGRLAPLAEAGAELRALDATKPKQFGPALLGLAAPAVVYSIPPPPGFPAGEAVRRAASAALAAGARAFVYLGTTGLYGSRPSEAPVDEDTPLDLGDEAMSSRILDESAVAAAAAAGLRTVTLRLAAIYGPGRGVRERMRRGGYTLAGPGEHWFSRIHVLDLVSIIRAAIERAPAGSLYCVADDRPARQREYAEWLAPHLGLPAPAPGPASPQPTVHRGRRVQNTRMKRDLGIALAYPTFEEGERQIDESEAGTQPGGSRPTGAD